MVEYSTALAGEGVRAVATNLPRYRRWTGVIGLAAADAVSFLAAFALFRNGRPVPEMLLVPARVPVDVFVLLAFLFIIARYLRGDYSRRRLFWDEARTTTLGLLLIALPCLALLAAFPTHYSAFAEFASWGFLLFALPLGRQAARLLLVRLGIWRVPTALIAKGSRGGEVYGTLKNVLTLGYDIRWIASDGTAQLDGAPVRRHIPLNLTDSGDLAVDLVREGCEQAVIATDDMGSTGFADLIQRLMEAGISVSFVPSFQRLPLVGFSISYFFGKDIVLFQMRSPLQHLPSRFSKRCLDIAGSLLLLALFAPLFLALALVISLYDGGPVFYSQFRSGRGGRPFRCFKFRTMAVDAEARLQQWRDDNPALYRQFLRTFKLVNDPRITGPGKWLRRTSLDELPQLWNVLRGDMSLVGPRPVLERELIEYYGPAAQLYRRIRPGLTGLWQVRGRSDTSYAERVVLDEWYTLNWSFWYDIVILLQTAWIVLSRKGAY